VNRLKVASRFVHSYELNVTYTVDGVRVTFLDANHCPGAAMILFQLNNGTNILHTGDFRMNESMLSLPHLKDVTLHTLHLDTTYCDQRYVFPTQEEVIHFVVEKVKKAIATKPNTLVLCGSYTIGKERIFVALAKAIGLKAGVTKEKKQILDCLYDRELESLTTTNVSGTKLHVVAMHKLNMKDLKIYLAQHPSCSALIAIRPTGWAYEGGEIDDGSWQCPQSSGSVTIYNVPYSEHSSVRELEAFVRRLCPKKVIPTVGVGDPKKRQYMMDLINTWIQ
jgi:DNA cross-link repair 1A protein